MAATFTLIENNLTATDTGSPAGLNFGSTNARDLDVSTYPISQGSYGFEKWIRALFTGTFTEITNVKIYKTSGNYVVGEGISYTGQVTTWLMPTNSQSSCAVTALPTSEPSSANVSIGGSLSGSLMSSGYTDYMVLQATIDTTAVSGFTATKTFTITYDEV